MQDKHYYGCCACIGAMGAGLISKMTFMKNKNGFVFNLFIPGIIETTTSDGEKIVFKVVTEYPKTGNVKIQINMDSKKEFSVLLRNPEWSRKTQVSVNDIPGKDNWGYIFINQLWKDGDIIEINFDMTARALYPISYGEQILMNVPIWGQNYMASSFDREDPQAKDCIAIQKGPLILAIENRLGRDVAKPLPIKINEDHTIDTYIDKDIAIYKHIAAFTIPLADGKTVMVTDYASAGKLWNDKSKMAAWIR